MANTAKITIAYIGKLLYLTYECHNKKEQKKSELIKNRNPAHRLFYMQLVVKLKDEILGELVSSLQLDISTWGIGGYFLGGWSFKDVRSRGGKR